MKNAFYNIKIEKGDVRTGENTLRRKIIYMK